MNLLVNFLVFFKLPFLVLYGRLKLFDGHTDLRGQSDCSFSIACMSREGEQHNRKERNAKKDMKEKAS